LASSAVRKASSQVCSTVCASCFRPMHRFAPVITESLSLPISLHIISSSSRPAARLPSIIMLKRLSLGVFVGVTKLLSQDDQLYIRQSADSDLKVFAGLSHRELAAEVAGHLGVQLGRVAITKFVDGETKVRVLDDVSDRDVFVVQSITAPVNDSLVELLFLISSLKTAHCKRVIAVIPFLAYTNRDHKLPGNDAILGADVVRMLEVMGADVVVSIDFHSPYVKGFFHVPTINLTALPLGASYFAGKRLTRPLVLSLTFSGFTRANAFQGELRAQGVECDIGILPYNLDVGELEQYRQSGLLPKDLQNRDIILVTDAIVTGRSCVQAVHLLRRHDVGRIYMFATHGIMLDTALGDINETSLTELVLTNTLPLKQETWNVRQLSVAKLLAEAIRRARRDEQTVSEYTNQ